MGRGRHIKSKRIKEASKTDDQMVRNLDALAEFERFKEEILPAVQKDVLAGMTAEELMVKYQTQAVARGISIALSPRTQDGLALQAVKDLMDRTMGKAKERSEVTHRMKDVPKEQIEARILTLLGKTKEQQDSDEDEDRGPLQ